MRTNIEYRTLGEQKGNFTNSSIRQPKETKVWYQQNAEDCETCEGMGDNAKLTLGLLAGAGAGLIAGLLLAPQRGADTRKKLTETASKLGSQVSKGFYATKVKAGDWTARSKSGQQSSTANQSTGSASSSKATGPDLAVD